MAVDLGQSHTHTHTHTHTLSLSLSLLITGFAVVHMMLDDVREKYHLEKLWALGPQFDDQYIEMLKYQENQKF